MSTVDTTDMTDIEERLRAALTARAELVRPEDLAPVAPVVPLRPRWQSPWVLLATAAVVLLVLGVVLQGVGGRPRSDRIAPKPDEPQVVLPDDVGRDWQVAPESTPARLDLDGDGRKEQVEFLGERTKEYDGRVRLQTTLTSTGEEAWGVADVETTIGLTAEGVIDADGDGDQELVVFDPDLDSGTNGGVPLVFARRDGLLVQAVPEDPELLLRGEVQVPGSRTELYDRAHVLQYWIDGGSLFSGRSEDSFARAGMTTAQLPGIVLETWEWRLDDDGVLRPEPAGCKELVFDVQDCDADSGAQVPDLTPATQTVGVGESADFTTGYPFSIRVEAGDPPLLVGEGQDGRTLRHELDVPDPRVATVQPESIFSDGESLVVTSASDPTLVQLLVQRGTRIVALDPVGEVPLENTDDSRTWLTEAGSVVSAVAGDDDSWQLWFWQMTQGDRVFALPGATVCFDDVADPTTARAC